MSDKGVVNLATASGPGFNAIQASPLDSDRIFAFSLTAGDDPKEHTLADRTELITITATFSTAEGLPYVELQRGPTGSKKRIFERDYAFSVVKVFADDDTESNPRLLTFDPPASGSAYIEIQEA